MICRSKNPIGLYSKRHCRRLGLNRFCAKSRRVKKVTPNATAVFFYDDWNLIEERIAYADGTTSTVKYYWGKDLSGSLQGAGGVGGLLYLTVDGVIYIPCYDNNGNITKYVDANGNVIASYTYDVFGKWIAKAGVLADFFRHRFSTKYFDVETELYYYGYRFYSPYLMRWLNRDPIEENGGLNLYGFCGNNGISNIDVLGFGRWNFNDSLPSFFESDNDTSIVVTYEMDASEQRCCNQVLVKRYVRKLLTGGMVGPYFQDGDDDQSFGDGNKGYAPTDWPEGPGVRIPYTQIGYRFSWSWDFLFEAICVNGPNSGKKLASVRKFYHADGHKSGAKFPKGSFSDPPDNWPDLTNVNIMLR